MKKIVIALMFLGLLMGMAGVSYAIPFTASDIDFSGDGSFGGRTYKDLQGGPGTYNFDWTQVITFSPPAISLNSAQLTISHTQNSGGAGEHWALWASKDNTNWIDIGDLGPSSGGWNDQVFTFTGSQISSLFPSTETASWTLYVRLLEDTTSNDHLLLDRSILQGDYNPVPEPATMLLFSSGLIGLAGFRRKFRN